MKLSHLSIAILSAITLAACGGGGSSPSLTDQNAGTKPVDQTPVQPPKTDTDPVVTEEEIIVDPAQTGVVGKLDFKTESSVGTTQYLRKKLSDFDRVDNPSEDTSATSIFGVSVNEQNPYLTNIALARLKDSRYPNMTLVQYLGVSGDRAPKYGDKDSLQQQNKHNVQFPALTEAADVVVTGDQPFITAQLLAVKNMITAYKKQRNLTPEQQDQLKQLLVTQADLQVLQAKLKANKTLGQKLVLVDGTKDTDQNRWGDLVETTSGVLDLSVSTDPASKTTGPVALGLVGINFREDERTPTLRAALGVNNPYRIVGTEENSRSSTRIFGRNFSYDDNKHKALNAPNSYNGATTIVEAYSKNALSNFAAINSTDPFDAIVNNYDAAANTDQDKVKWSLAAEPMSLAYVQYGRVTGNLDPEEFTQDQIDAGKALNYAVRQFRNKEADDSVDTYFYRGPESTTIEQMDALAKKGGELVYRGHALMYGIDNEFHNKTPDAVPTAFGVTDMKGLGNFVEAKVDLSKGRLDDGFVYNVWHEKDGRQIIRDVLVQFDGNIYGNTVIGEAQRTYNTSDKADFRASFFGPNADELGGSFNSTTYQERYGAQGDVWGGVFGAKRATGSTLSNQQLGDIAPLTTKSK